MNFNGKHMSDYMTVAEKKENCTGALRHKQRCEFLWCSAKQHWCISAMDQRWRISCRRIQPIVAISIERRRRKKKWFRLSLYIERIWRLLVNMSTRTPVTITVFIEIMNVIAFPLANPVPMSQLMVFFQSPLKSWN